MNLENNKRKILYIPARIRCLREFGTMGEVINRLKEDSNNEIYILNCNDNIKQYCWISTHYKWLYCNRCKKYCNKIFELTNFPKDYILNMERYKLPKIDNINTLEDLLNYEIDGYNLGFSVASCLISSRRDDDINVKKEFKVIKRFMETAYVTIKNIIKFDEKIHFDEIHIFNGRFTITHPAVLYAKQKNIPYFSYEHGGNYSRMLILKNTVPHDFYSLKERIKESWDNGESDREKVAIKWLEDRRKGETQAIKSFTRRQKKDKLPKDFDRNKTNIAIFNSSAHEIAAFDSWKLPFVKNENELIENILEHYKNDNTKHFYLRIHPNLKKSEKNKIKQIKQIYQFEKKYNNLTVISSTEKVDTYALMQLVDKVFVSYSTVGCEATYWGTPSICIKSPYEDLDCSYKATSYEEIFEFLDDKNLKPKSKENVYPYAYYCATLGDEYKYFKPASRKEGSFLGYRVKEFKER